MILQSYYKFSKEVNRFGCYFLSLLYLASQKAKRTIGIGDVEEFYRIFVEKGWMDRNCFIQLPEDILNFLGVPVRYLGHREGHYPTAGDEYEVLCFRRVYRDKDGEVRSYKHFCVGDGLGHVAYDPMGMSNAVKYGELVSKRIFSLS